MCKATIFLDMDGVIADFAGGAAEIFGYDVEEWPAGVYDIAEVFGESEPAIWDKIERDAGFWVTLKAYPWSTAIVDLCRKNGRTVIASSPSRDPASLSEKARWLRVHYPDIYEEGAYMFGPAKELLAGAPGAVLIDDNPKNIESFEAAGGLGILFPQRWNDLHYICDGYEKYSHVRDRLREIIGDCITGGQSGGGEKRKT